VPSLVRRGLGSWATKPTRVTYPPWFITILLGIPGSPTPPDLHSG
jgi:hypothetical protein